MNVGLVVCICGFRGKCVIISAERAGSTCESNPKMIARQNNQPHAGLNHTRQQMICFCFKL